LKAGLKASSGSDMESMKETPAYVGAKSMLPPELHAIFDELITDYRFAALKHHGREWISPKVIAELVLMGWRFTTPALPPTRVKE
jgi:hypothetical protein